MELLLLSVGAFFGGLVLGFRDLVPLLASQKTGVIRRRGFHAIRVHRDADPERFARLAANRSRGAAMGFGLFFLGAIGLGLIALSIGGFDGPLAAVVMTAWCAFIAFAAWCLIRGFKTGRMFAFWNLNLFGEATLTENPVWFWTYAAINAFIVVSGLLAVLGVAVG